jgi:hypothetical protein
MQPSVLRCTAVVPIALAALRRGGNCYFWSWTIRRKTRAIQGLKPVCVTT